MAAGKFSWFPGWILMRCRQWSCPLLMSCRSRTPSWSQPKWCRRHADVLIPWLLYFLFSYLGKRAYFCLDEHRFPKLSAWLPCVSVKYLISRSGKWETREVWSVEHILTKKMLAAVTFPDRPAEAEQNQGIYTVLMKGYILGRDIFQWRGLTLFPTTWRCTFFTLINRTHYDLYLMMTEPVIDYKLFEFSAFTYILHNNCNINIILWTT